MSGLFNFRLDTINLLVVSPFMAGSTVEEQKQAYSRELVEYTKRQWNAVRKPESQPDKREEGGSSSGTSPDEDGRSRRPSRQQTPHNADGTYHKLRLCIVCMLNSSEGVQAIDFAHMSLNSDDSVRH